MDYLYQVWPKETDTAFQFLLYFIGQPIVTLTRIGESHGVDTLATVALGSGGLFFVIGSGLYSLFRTIKGIAHGAHSQQWIQDERSTYSVLGPIVAFFGVFPWVGLGGLTIFHSIVVYSSVTGIGIGGRVSTEIANAIDRVPLVVHGSRNQIHPVAQQIGITMLGAHLCMNVIDRMEKEAGVSRSVEHYTRSHETDAGPFNSMPSVTPGGAGGQYDAIIQQAGIRWGVAPALIHAVIDKESSYKPNAVSHAGATGLMQLMPATADRFGVTDARDPVQNVNGGTEYLAWLLDRYDGRIDLALAGYHAGEGNVDDCMCIPGTNDGLSTTQQYVANVLNSYNMNTAAGIPGVAEGTLHMMRVNWGGGSYPADLCGSLEFPIGWTSGEESAVDEMLHRVVTRREIAIEVLEQRLGRIADAMMNKDWDRGELAEAMTRAMMGYDFSMHAEAREAYGTSSSSAMTAFTEDVRTEGWIAFSQYFSRIGEMAQAISAGASFGIVPRSMTAPSAYIAESTSVMLAGHLARIDALLDRASAGTSERARLQIAQDIASENGLDDLRNEVETYSQGWLRYAAAGGTASVLHRYDQQPHPREAELRAREAHGGGEGGILRSVVNVILTHDGRFPLLKYQEIGETLLGVGAGAKMASILPTKLGDFLSAAGALLLITGLVFAVFLPGLPLIIWVLAATLWFITVVFSLATAPIWGMFHNNWSRALPGWFDQLRLVMLPSYIVIMYTLTAGVLVIADFIIYVVFVDPILRYAQAQEYLITLGWLFLYGFLALVSNIMIMNLPMVMTERLFHAVRSAASAMPKINYRGMMQTIRSPM